ncbi:MAG: AmmeMemoRadiSam system radical SAM enzyme [Heliobacteriaceae bacterium]|nr:AmmeMemoRadiSam system radical SAM enzyme [Heliobacteriaceae bacterium]
MMSRCNSAVSRWCVITNNAAKIEKEAAFYRVEPAKAAGRPPRVECLLCPWHCRIPDGRTGICQVRKNAKGRLYSLNYGKVTGLALDPIEKKPLKRFHPGTMVLSFGSFGCNLNCGFCQNHQLAHGADPGYREVSPAAAVAMAMEAGKFGSIGLAYTYSEPGVWFEYIQDTAPLIREAGLKNILVTNGYLETAPLEVIVPYIDAVNLDIKGFTEDYYRTACKGRLQPVLAAAKTFKAACHLEITTLIVPGQNDREADLTALFDWVATELGRDTPLHLSRYFPQYKYKLPPTPLETMRQAAKLARQRLDQVFLGNMIE